MIITIKLFGNNMEGEVMAAIYGRQLSQHITGRIHETTTNYMRSSNETA
jgi:hypothetical protein